MTTFTFERRIRPSSLPSWADCPRRQAAVSYRALVEAFGYQLRDRVATVGAAVGSGVHAAAAYSLTEKRQSGGASMGPVDEAIDRAIAAYDERVEQDGVVYDDVTDRRDTAQRQIARMTRSYRDQVAPDLLPLLVEERVEAPVGDGWTVSGQLDTLNASPGAVHDLKTGKAQRANGMQYGAYVLLFRAHRFEADAIVEDFVPRVRLRAEQPPPRRTGIDVDVAIGEAWSVIEDLKRGVDEMVRRATTVGEAPPHLAVRANPASSLCSDRYCPAWGTDFCRAHKGAV